jgi:seryl-tRNA synthetase
MTSNELWKVNTLELPSTIAAANDPNPYRSLSTILSDKQAEPEESRIPKAAKLAKFQSRHKELDKKVVHTKASLEREHKTLAELTAQTKTLQASTKNQEKELASINERIDSLVTAATPIREEIITFVAQLLKKHTEEKAASDAEAEATHRSSILLEYHRSNGKVFMTAMKTYHTFSDWKSTKGTRNIGPQTEAILSSSTTFHASFHRWNSNVSWDTYHPTTM